MLFLVPATAPTAASASVAGRITTGAGRGIDRAYVTLTDQNGKTVTAITNPFGYFTFTEAAAGETYVISAHHKRYQFAPSSQVINVVENVADIQFTAY